MAPRLGLLEAKFEQVLLYADGPQVVLLSGPVDTKVVGVAIDDGSCEYPFFSAQISHDQFIDYLNEKFDLRYLLHKPAFRKNFLFDLGKSIDGVIPLTRVELSAENRGKYLPDAGLFARAHTERLEVTLRRPTSEQIFGVDGSWDLPEFSRFYGNVSDLYAVFNSIDLFLDDQAADDKKARIKGAFNKPFEGGGSYLSLFESLTRVPSQETRLRVEGISYNSPGYVRLRGRAKAFAEIKQLLGTVENNSHSIAESYKALRFTLAKLGLLSANAESFVADSLTGKIITEQSRDLAQQLDVIDFDSLKIMANDNTLIVAKVLLSIWRRADRLFQFFLEGRVSFDTPSSRSSTPLMRSIGS